ncbi:retrotransposon protein, putative, ty1-copia subclass, partial [Tanacetum coccineum]
GKNQGNRKSKLAYAPAYVPKPKIPPPTKKNNPAKDVIYHECSKIGIFTIELYYFPNKSWVYDTGCGTHICNTTQGLRGSKKLKPRALNLGIISVSRLKDNGFVNCFIDNGIYVSKDGLLYFHSIPRDGIYEIDLYCDNSNDKSIHAISNKRAKLNLDYTLLWHYRLRHIHKKQIEKLQHDGILKSTDHESFDKCVSCMSELCQDKEQATLSPSLTTLVVMVMFTCQEFLDHLKEHEIIAHRTPPYTPQHNGVSERRNRNLVDMVHSMMSQTTLPKSFWDYVIESVARNLNMVPTKKVEKTLYEVWHDLT